MAKNIVICSDGTGNRGGKTRGTNVWRIFNAVDRYNEIDNNNNPVEQITHYDDGVGTDDLLWLRLLGGAFGWGLSRNIRSAYAFLAMNYELGDRIFLFGFSRGAYTVRSLAGMISRCGLLKREEVINAGRQRKKVLKRILKAYRSAKTVNTSQKQTDAEKAKCVREALEIGDLCFHSDPVPIHFIGVWDTVDAVGMPFDEIKVVDTIWRRVRKKRLWGFHDRRLGRHVHHAYQALALDDERKTFHPLIWEHANTCPEQWRNDVGPDPVGNCAENGPKGPIIEQVWFAGVHSNVGGGYPKDSMALVSLDWMMGKAEACGLRFAGGVREEFQRNADVHGRLYDSRAGLGAFYRYAPRNLYQQPVNPQRDDQPLTPAIHGSVLERIQRGTDYYAPKVIRENSCTITWTDSGPYAEPQAGDTGSTNVST